MLKVLIEKEIKHLIQSPKFVATFLVCTLLIILSVFVGIMDYKAAVKQYSAANQLNQQKMEGASSWTSMSSMALRQPDPMQIFITGVQNDIGRFSSINRFDQVKLTNSIYADDPIFAVFRFMDMAFIFQMILSLFAILFTYDAVNGEREGGTLKLIFSNAISRVRFILSKFIGAWIGLLVSLSIPVLLSIFLVFAFSIPFTGEHWVKLAMFMGIAILYLTVFMAMGLFISAITRNTSTSFLVLLIIWVSTTLIIPRGSLLLAGKMIPVSTVAEIEGQLDKFSKDRWIQHEKKLAERWRHRSAEMGGMADEDREVYRDEHMWQWMEEDDDARNQIQKDITGFSRKLHEELRNKKMEQENYALSISRMAPSSSFQLASMKLAGTDIGLKNRNLDVMNIYRDSFVNYIEKKQKESGQHGGIQISISSDGGFNVNTPRMKGKLDISGIPKFKSIKQNLSNDFNSILFDTGLLLFISTIFFMLAMVSFLKYDVR